jgi:hypothetical protein
MSLFWHVPGFPSYKYDTREGDTQFFLHYDDKTGKRKFLVIDGGTPTYFNILYRDLLLFGASTPDSEMRIAATHGHYDHIKGLRLLMAHKTKGKYTFNITTLYCYNPDSLKKGLRNNKGSDYVRSAINTMWDMINEAKARGIKVVFLNNKQKVVWGDIKFQNFREQPGRVADDDKYGDSYLNDGSLCFWFWEQRYLTTGDGPERIDKLCDKYDLDPVMVKGPHHGNNFIRKCATWMKDNGTWLYWDNDLSNIITDFLETGREDAIAVGMTVMNVIGAINGIFYNGMGVIYKGNDIHRYKCPYKGGFKTIGVDAAFVRKILRGSFGNGDTRTTYVLCHHRFPGWSQQMVNKVIALAKDIKSGKKDYGENKDRLNRIDKELGKGYGQLVQDYINVLCGIRKSV